MYLYNNVHHRSLYAHSCLSFMCIEFLMLYDCKTFHASSGSPVLKVVDGKLQVVAIHRGFLHGTYYNLSSRFSDVLNYISSTDNKGLITI